ncbi:MAG: TrmH family RNA methyltransferase [Candidatus Micrarchaeales archaeon]|jgi:TrmH family RNA methyltransferase
MQVKLIILEPKYQVNLGYIARVSMNFGVRKLFIVRPRAKLDGKKARMYAKHAYSLLEGARVYRNLDDAIRGCDLLIGTTGIKEKAKANFRRIYFAEDAVERMKRLRSDSVVGLLIGRDDIGLRRDEVEKCDMLAYISTDPNYPVLNVSHALAIFLYLIKRNGLRTLYEEGFRRGSLNEDEMRALLSLFKRLIDKKSVRDKAAVMSVFRRIIRNTQPSKQELHALITALK